MFKVGVIGISGVEGLGLGFKVYGLGCSNSTLGTVDTHVGVIKWCRCFETP